MSLVIHRPSLRVVGQKLRVKHWGAKLALRLLSTTTPTTSRVLGVVYRLSQKARSHIHRRMLPSPKLGLLTGRLRKQPRSKG